MPAAEVASDVLKSAAELDRALRNEGIEFVQALKEKRAKVALANMMAEKEHTQRWQFVGQLPNP